MLSIAIKSLSLQNQRELRVKFNKKQFFFYAAGLLALTSTFKLNAANPFDGGFTQPEPIVKSKRVPAQMHGEFKFPILNEYMNQGCYDLLTFVEGEKTDMFKVYLLKNLGSDFCDQVREGHGGIDDETSQADREYTGMGTFSKIIEIHYNGYLENELLPFYHDQTCEHMMNPNSDDRFIRYFAREVQKVNKNICEDIRKGHEMDSDIAQANARVGRGTFAKLIDISFEEFRFLEK